MKVVAIFLLLVIALVIIYFIFFKKDEIVETGTEKVFTTPYQSGAVRTKQVEAKNLLSAISQEQAMHYAQHGEYSSDLKQLQKLSMGKYYKLSILKADANGFTAEARGNIDNDATIDVWRIDENSKLVNTVNDVTQ